MIRFIEAYEQREGQLPETIIIHRYGPKSGDLVQTDRYKPSNFFTLTYLRSSNNGNGT